MTVSSPYCEGCDATCVSPASLKPGDACPVCGATLVVFSPSVPPEDSEEFEQEMFFLGHEWFFDEFF